MIREVDRPVNVLAIAGAPAVAELAEAGVSRISVGGSFAYAAVGALVAAATELRDQGTYGYLAASAFGREAARPRLRLTLDLRERRQRRSGPGGPGH